MLIVAIISFATVCLSAALSVDYFKYLLSNVHLENILNLIDTFAVYASRVLLGCFALCGNKKLAVTSFVIEIIDSILMFILHCDTSSNIISNVTDLAIAALFIINLIAFVKKQNHVVLLISGILPLIIHTLGCIVSGSANGFEVSLWDVVLWCSWYLPFAAYAVYDYFDYKNSHKTVPEQLKELACQFSLGKISAEDYTSARSELLKKL